MDAFLKELNRRYKIVDSKFAADVLFCLCDYLDLLVWSKEAQDILKLQEQEVGQPKNIWKQYKILHNNVYDPIRIAKVNPEKHFPHFYWLYEEDHDSGFLPLYLLFPPTAKFFWHKFKYRQCLKDVHEQMVIHLKNRELFPLPESAKNQPTELATALGITPQSNWQDIKIKFKKPGTNLEIIYSDKIYVATHEQLGFVSKLNGIKPKLYWTFLRVMALNEDTGIFPLHKFTGTERATHNKTKQFLAAHLKKLFGISSDPFEPYDKDEQIYQIKIQLVPEKDFRKDWLDRNTYTEEADFLSND